MFKPLTIHRILALGLSHPYRIKLFISISLWLGLLFLIAQVFVGTREEIGQPQDSHHFSVSLKGNDY